MRVVALASGSQANATLVEIGGARLLVDAGLSAKLLAARLRAAGVDPQRIDAVLLSHEHQDHARGAERFSRGFGAPVYCLRETLEALDVSPAHLAAWHVVPECGRLDLGSVVVDCFPVPHDAAKPLGFVLHGEGLRVGFATDLGHATTLVRERLRGCELLLVEANHDDGLLRDGPYPWHLKQRVGGRLGHLSNDEAAELLRSVAGPECRGVILAHLSEQNNTRALASRAAARALVDARALRAELRVAARRALTPALVL